MLKYGILFFERNRTTASLNLLNGKRGHQAIYPGVSKLQVTCYVQHLFSDKCLNDVEQVFEITLGLFSDYRHDRHNNRDRR